MQDASDSLACLKRAIEHAGAKHAWTHLPDIVEANHYQRTFDGRVRDLFAISGVYRLKHSDNPFDLTVAISKCHLELRELAWTKPGRAALIQLFREERHGGTSISQEDIVHLLQAWREQPPADASCDLLRTPEACTIRWSVSGSTEPFTWHNLEATFAGRVLCGFEDLPDMRSSAKPRSRWRSLCCWC